MPALPSGFRFRASFLLIAYLASFCAILYLYWPALHGHFVFDDRSLFFFKPNRDAPIGAWLSGVRPVLMASYWVNYHLWGLEPFSYHFVNLVIHFLNTGLVFLVLLRLLGMAGWARTKAAAAAMIGALIFAIHPLQTEAVSYVAGRSESLASLFMLLAYVVFLTGRDHRYRGARRCWSCSCSVWA